MKKSLFMLLCAACVALSGCKKESTVEDPETPQKPTADTTTYVANVRIYSSIDEQKYLTFTYLFKNSTSEAYDTLRNVKEVPVDKDLDAPELIHLRDSAHLLRVFAADFRLAKGTYYLHTIRDRNTTPLEVDSIYFINGVKLLSTDHVLGSSSLNEGVCMTSDLPQYILVHNKDKYKCTITVQ